MLLSSIFGFGLFVLSVDAAGNCGYYTLDSAGETLSFSSYGLADFRTLGSPSASAASAGITGKSRASYSDAKLKNNRNAAALQSYWTNPAGGQGFWQKQEWDRNRSPVPMKNVDQNVFIDYDPTSTSNGTMLSLTTSRGQDGVQLAGEVTTAYKLNYGSIRFEARVTGDPGACAGLFTYLDDTHESDFEFLTQEGPNYVHLTNQPGQRNGNPVPGAHTNWTLQVPYNQWNTYRIDWTPGMTRYYVNGEIVVNKTINVSEEPMLWMMNIWSDGTTWPGVMKIGDSARLDIRWVVLVYNTPGEVFGAPNSGTACGVMNEMDGQGLYTSSVTTTVVKRQEATKGPSVAEASKLPRNRAARRVFG